MSQNKIIIRASIVCGVIIYSILHEYKRNIFSEKQTSKRATIKITTTQECKVLSWQEYFMSIAIISSLRSKDPSRKVGCCIVDNHNRIVSIGYNGFPRGCCDTQFPWGKKEEWIDTKYPYVCHAEANAILNCKNTSCSNCKLYCTLFPCNECAKLIIQSDISHIYYIDDTRNCPSRDAAIRMFQSANVKYTQINPVSITLS